MRDFLERASFDVDHASAFVFRNGGFLHANLVAQLLLGEAFCGSSLFYLSSDFHR